jgi:hypothetical protein
MNNRGYSPTALFNAYMLVRDTGIPIKTAARQYGVPHSTLRDRVKGRIDPETIKPGPDPLFSQEQEAKLVAHIKTMADLGYGFTITEVVDKATNYAVYLGKRSHDKPLSVKWFKGFRQRWPELRVIKPRALSNYRASSTSQAAVSDYFTNLEAVLKTNNLLDKPECIYNVDEKGIQTEHAPPYIVSGKSRTPAITSSRSAITTVIGCGNALGTQIPPYFVFKGQRMNNDLLIGSTPGCSGTTSKSGWSNSAVFLEYLENHFMKYIQRRDENQPILLIFDGHRSHVNVPLLDWAKKNNIILFVLPAHTSHVLQPLDVGCFGPLQKIYNASCHRFLRENPSTKITRYNVAALASASYVTALSNNNLRSAFKKTGIFPLNTQAISPDQFVPSEPYTTPPKEKVTSTENQEETVDLDAFFQSAEEVIEKKKEFNQGVKKNSVSSLVSGKEITNPLIHKEIKEKSDPKSSEPHSTSKKRKSNDCPKSSGKRPIPSKQQTQSAELSLQEPIPGPSHINLVNTTDFSSDEEIEDNDKCCVCKLFQPKELHGCVSLVFTKWAQCDSSGCSHWTHLQFCCRQTVIRRHDTFICPCHDQQNTEE